MKTPQNVVVVLRGVSYGLVGCHDDSSTGRMSLLNVCNALHQTGVLSYEDFAKASSRLFVRRTRVDKRASVRALLVGHPEMADSLVARVSRTSRTLVTTMRRELDLSETTPRTFLRCGRKATMDVRNLGRSKTAGRIKREIDKGTFDETTIASDKVVAGVL